MANQMDTVFGALANPTRRAVLARLGRGEAPVSELAAPHAMALPSFLKHVRVLETAGLVRSRKEGRVRICTLRPEGLRLAERWMRDQRSVWEGRLDRLEAYLSTEEDP